MRNTLYGGAAENIIAQISALKHGIMAVVEPTGYPLKEDGKMYHITDMKYSGQQNAKQRLWWLSLAVCGGFLAALSLGQASGQEHRSQDEMTVQLREMSLLEITADPELKAYALNRGEAAFQQNCTGCHGPEAKGQAGIPNLTDQEWMWGGDLETIYTTIRYGVRTEHFMTQTSTMPSMVDEKVFSEEEARGLAEFILELPNKPDYFSPPGILFTSYCTSCHGAYGEGYTGFGAPSINDSTWFYGGAVEDIFSQIMSPKHGVMPDWENKLRPEEIKSLAIYVRGLSGGQD